MLLLGTFLFMIHPEIMSKASLSNLKAQYCCEKIWPNLANLLTSHFSRAFQIFHIFPKAKPQLPRIGHWNSGPCRCTWQVLPLQPVCWSRPGKAVRRSANPMSTLTVNCLHTKQFKGSLSWSDVHLFISLRDVEMLAVVSENWTARGWKSKTTHITPAFQDKANLSLYWHVSTVQ